MCVHLLGSSGFWQDVLQKELETVKSAATSLEASKTALEKALEEQKNTSASLEDQLYQQRQLLDEQAEASDALQARLTQVLASEAATQTKLQEVQAFEATLTTELEESKAAVAVVSAQASAQAAGKDRLSTCQSEHFSTCFTLGAPQDTTRAVWFKFSDPILWQLPVSSSKAA